jgi:hypothetical protein
MTLGKKDSPARLRSSFEQLYSSARSLNSSSDELSKIIAAFDDTLKKLNLGVSAWVTFSSASDEPGWYTYFDQLGYTKLSGKWGISIREMKRDEQNGEDELLQESLFADAARTLRVKAIDGLPDLIETLLTEVRNANKSLDQKVGVARDLLKALKDFGVGVETAEVEK